MGKLVIAMYRLRPMQKSNKAKTPNGLDFFEKNLGFCEFCQSVKKSATSIPETAFGYRPYLK